MFDLDDFLKDIEGFCARRGIAESYFGLLAEGSGAFMSRLRARRNISLHTYKKIMAFMREHEDPTKKLSRPQPKQKKSYVVIPDVSPRITPDDNLRIVLRLIVGALCQRLGVSAEAALSRPRHSELTTASGEIVTVARIRARAAWLLHTSLSIPQVRVAALLDVSKQAVSKSLPLVEDEIDDPNLAEIMASLDHLLREPRP